MTVYVALVLVEVLKKANFMKSNKIVNLLCVTTLLSIFNLAFADGNDEENIQVNHRYCGDGLLPNKVDYNSFMSQIPTKSSENMKLWEKLFNHQVWSANEKRLIDKLENNYYQPYVFRTGESKNLCRILHDGYIANDEKEFDLHPTSKEWNNRVYSATKCVFTSIGGPVMTSNYGDVLYVLNDDQLRSYNAWASTSAPGFDGAAPAGNLYLNISMQLGFQGLYIPLTSKQLSLGQEIAANQVLASSDWGIFIKYITMLYTHTLKNKDEVITTLLNENDRIKFWTLINKNGALPAEIHYDSKIPLNDVRSITISNKIKDMLIESCPTDYDSYKDKIIIDNSSKQ